ncbi:MAG: hypothetical protein Q4D96_07425 [Propionibacteriaceae bacterium]|nr:hypothetical protein [Propionibacteriaceae bacterium]
MSVSTDGLMNWPSPEALQDASLTLVERGNEFMELVETAHVTWRDLANHYESPYQHLLHSALDSAQHEGDQVAVGCSSIALAMDAFAEAVHALKNRRTALLEDAATFNAKELDPEAEDYLDKVKEGVALQGRIDALVNEYKATIEECHAQLGAISNEGLPGDPSRLDEIARDGMLTTATTVAESRKVRIHRAVRRVVVRIGEREFRLPPHRVKWKTGGRFWDRSWGSPPPAAPGDVGTKMRSGLLETIFGPKPGQYGRPHVFSSEGKTFFKGKLGVGVQSTVTTKIGTSGWGRAIGRGLFAAGIVFTFTSEYEKADKRYREQNPELTEQQRQLKTLETTTVRSTSQITAAVGAGLAIGAAIPVGGPLIGLGVGLAVGLGMSIPVGKDKTIGDAVADAAENFWNFAKGLFG